MVTHNADNKRLFGATGSLAIYKFRTQTVVNFLARFQNGASAKARKGASHGAASLTAPQMLECARKINAEPSTHDDIPNDVLSALRSAIGLRKEVNQWYRSFTDDNVGHECFIDVLEQISKMLHSAQLARRRPDRRSAAHAKPAWTAALRVDSNSSPPSPVLSPPTDPREALANVPSDIPGISIASAPTEGIFNESTKVSSHVTSATLKAAPAEAPPDEDSSNVSNLWRASAPIGDEPNEEFFAIVCMLCDLRRLAAFVHQTWRNYDEFDCDFDNSCIISNLAIRRMQSICESSARDYPRLSTAASLHESLGIRVDSTGDGFCVTSEMTRSQNSTLLAEGTVMELLYPGEYCSLVTAHQFYEQTVRQHGSHMFNDIGINPASIAFHESLGRLSQYLVHGEYSTGCDTFMDGLKETLSTGQIPVWLPCALASLEIVHTIVGERTKHAWSASRLLAVQIDRSIDSLHQEPGRFWCFNGFGKLQRFAKAVCDTGGVGCGNEMAQAKHACIERFPSTACGLGQQMRIARYLYGFKLCNTESVAALTAWVYRACQSSELLFRPWEDMEYVLEKHGHELGPPPCEQSSSGMADHTYLNFLTQLNQGAEYCLVSCLSEIEACGFTEHSSVAELWGWYESFMQRSLPRGDEDHHAIEGLSSLFSVLEREKPEVEFDYITFARHCIVVLRSINIRIIADKLCENDRPSFRNALNNILQARQQVPRLDPASSAVQECPLKNASDELNTFISKHGSDITRRANSFTTFLSKSKMTSEHARRRMALTWRRQEAEQAVREVYNSTVYEMTGLWGGSVCAGKRSQGYGIRVKKLKEEWVREKMTGLERNEYFVSQVKKLVKKFHTESIGQ